MVIRILCSLVALFLCGCAFNGHIHHSIQLSGTQTTQSQAPKHPQVPAVRAIEIRSGGEVFVCTGTVIGPGIIQTALHGLGQRGDEILVEGYPAEIIARRYGSECNIAADEWVIYGPGCKAEDDVVILQVPEEIAPYPDNLRVLGDLALQPGTEFYLRGLPVARCGDPSRRKGEDAVLVRCRVVRLPAWLQDQVSPQLFFAEPLTEESNTSPGMSGGGAYLIDQTSGTETAFGCLRGETVIPDYPSKTLLKWGFKRRVLVFIYLSEDTNPAMATSANAR